MYQPPELSSVLSSITPGFPTVACHLIDALSFVLILIVGLSLKCEAANLGEAGRPGWKAK